MQQRLCELVTQTRMGQLECTDYVRDSLTKCQAIINSDHFDHDDLSYSSANLVTQNMNNTSSIL